MACTAKAPGRLPTASRAPRLPQELCEEILGHLRDDKKALKECSVVCKDWLPRASVHLFHTFRWPPCRVGRPCYTDRCPGSQCFVRCKEALSSSLRLRSYVREFVFAKHICGIPATNSRRLPFSLLFEMVELVPRLRKLVVALCGLQADVSPDMHRLKGQASLDEMRLNDPDVSFILELLPYFSETTKMTLVSFGQTNLAFRPSTTPPVPSIDVHELTISGNLNEDAFIRLGSMLKPASLRQLVLSNGRLSPAVGAIIQGAIELSALSYRVSHDNSPATLSLSPPLQTIHISSNWDLTPDLAPDHPLFAEWEDVARDIGELATPSLMCIHIGIMLVPVGQIDDYTACLRWYLLRLDWPAFLDGLQRCGALKAVVLEITDAFFDSNTDGRRQLLQEIVSLRVPPSERDKIEIRV